MTGVSDWTLIRVRGDAWKFAVRYTDKDGAPIDLSDFEVDGRSSINWPDGSVTLPATDVDLETGEWTLKLINNAAVPEGRSARLFVRIYKDGETQTLAVVPLQVIVP